MIEAILEFIKSGRFLKEINATLVSLVPRCQHPVKVANLGQ